jgi:formyl-CoA transferase
MFAPALYLYRPVWFTNSDRFGARDAVIGAVNDAFSLVTTSDLLERLDELGVPAGKVRDLEEVYTWEQTRSQGLLIDVDHSALGIITLPGPAVRFDELPFAGGRRINEAPPTLDEHGSAIRAWLAAETG